MEAELKELEKEEELLYKQLENIMFINEFSKEEKKELIILINKLIDVSKEIETGYCNQ